MDALLLCLVFHVLQPAGAPAPTYPPRYSEGGGDSGTRVPANVTKTDRSESTGEVCCCVCVRSKELPKLLISQEQRREGREA